LDNRGQSGSIFFGAVPLREIKLAAEHSAWTAAYVTDQFGPHQHPPVFAVFMPDPVLRLVKRSGVCKVRMQALRHSLMVLGMQDRLGFVPADRGLRPNSNARHFCVSGGLRCKAFRFETLGPKRLEPEAHPQDKLASASPSRRALPPVTP
jgi:hypothetical protein